MDTIDYILSSPMDINITYNNFIIDSTWKIMGTEKRKSYSKKERFLKKNCDSILNKR